MHRLAFLAIALTVLILALPIAVAFADVSVGVKTGDWIEYQVTVTGNPPEDHNLTWARMEVTDVQDTAISLEIQTRFSNGTLLPERITLNLATGVLGDDFLIPKNLNIGDQFYDSRQGNITITGMEQRTAVGAQRTVVSAETTFTTFYWDRETGILIAATSHEPTYTMITETNGTNIWQPQLESKPQILGLEPALFYAVIATAVVIVLAIVVAILIWRRRNKS